MKILVTGGCGFLGSHLCEELSNLGTTVVSYDNLTKYELSRTGFNVEAARDYNWNFLKKLGVSLLKEDVCDGETLTQVASTCDAILHTAAQPAMTIACENPRKDIETNVLGSFNVLEAARQAKIPVVNTSTIHVYGNDINSSLKEGEDSYLREPEDISELAPAMTGLLTPLHASKMASENYVRTYVDTYRLQAANFRLTGIYGERQFGGEDHGWVANFCIRTALDQPIQIFGSGKQVRDILYVKDAVKAYLLFLKSPCSGTFNIGGGPRTKLSLLQCIKIIQEISQQKINVVFGDERLGDLRYFVCDTSRAEKSFGFTSNTLPAEGIKKLLTWVQSNKDFFTHS